MRRLLRVDLAGEFVRECLDAAQGEKEGANIPAAIFLTLDEDVWTIAANLFNRVPAEVMSRGDEQVGAFHSGKVVIENRPNQIFIVTVQDNRYITGLPKGAIRCLYELSRIRIVVVLAQYVGGNVQLRITEPAVRFQMGSICPIIPG